MKINNNLKKINKLFYFKVTFLAVSAGLFAGLFVYGLFDVDFSNGQELANLLLKSLATGVGAGLVLGILNMFLKIGNFPKRKD